MKVEQEHIKSNLVFPGKFGIRKASERILIFLAEGVCFFHVCIYGSKCWLGAFQTCFFRMSDRVVEGKGAAGNFFFKKLFCEFFKPGIFREYMIRKITNSNTGQKDKTKSEKYRKNFSWFRVFKRHTILTKVSVFTILLEKTGLYVMIDTGQLKS